MSEYETEFETDITHRVRRRLGYNHDRGQVTKFVVQLEYCLGDDWFEIVRFDHDPDAEGGHDVTDEGLHMDIYRRGTKISTEDVFPPLPANDALDLAEMHLTKHLERYVKRFEQWHGIRNDRSGL